MSSLDTTNYHEKYMKYKCNYLALKELTVEQDGGEETSKKSTKNILKNMENAVNKNFKGVNTVKLINNIKKRIGSKEDIQKILKNSDKQTLPPHVNKIIEEEINKDKKLTAAVNKTIKDLGGIEKVKEQIEFIHKTTSFSKDLASKMIFVESHQTGGMSIEYALYATNMRRDGKIPLTEIQYKAVLPFVNNPKKTIAAAIYSSYGVLSLVAVWIAGHLIAIYMAVKCNKGLERSFMSSSMHIIGAASLHWFYIIYQTIFHQKCIQYLNKDKE
jgi:hypothetical protein